VALDEDVIMKVEDKVALCAIKHHEESHIRLEASLCGKCQTRICIRACPAHLYSLEQDQVKVDHTGCLECGTCLVVCPLGAVSWKYPQGGFGIRYRHG
jgi:ferredoxin like protein